MRPVFSKAVSWFSGRGEFVVEASHNHAELRTPDGQVLNLGVDEWLEIKTALTELFPARQNKNSKRASLPENHGEPWNTELDGRLKNSWEQAMSIVDLARDFGRTPGAIRSRLEKLGVATFYETEAAG